MKAPSRMKHSGQLVERRKRAMSSKVLTALIFAFAATVAWAQPKPAFVQDRDEPGRNPFQLRIISSDCDGQIICFVNAPSAVPAGRRLVMTQLSIGLSTTGAAGEPVYAELTDTGFADGAAVYVSGPGGSRAGTFPIQRYYEAGTTPRVAMSIANGEMSGTTRILFVGYYIVLP